jgi:hypothetical protein
MISSKKDLFAYNSHKNATIPVATRIEPSSPTTGKARSKVGGIYGFFEKYRSKKPIIINTKEEIIA